MKVSTITTHCDDEYFFNCECGCVSHSFNFSYMKPDDSSDDNVVYCSIFLYQYRNFWQRIPQAFNIALGKTVKNGCYDCVNVRSKDCDKMIVMLDRLSPDCADENTTECCIADYRGRHNLRFEYGLWGGEDDGNWISHFNTEVHYVPRGPFQNLKDALYYLLFRYQGWMSSHEFEVAERHAPLLKAMAKRHGAALIDV
ncbi:MAG: hypothetical protein HC888_03055 [Candidatus Competibacteraceae bacterium]|nr:hypothetical protein [Candidatus Competibacteraceae bacterium]